jgi:hypothetical protein
VDGQTRSTFRHSFVERQNWTVRTTMRRYTRLSNGFSRKMENHAAATALNYFAYNFIKIHRTLRTSPAMAAGVTDRLWSVEDLVALWEAYEQRRAERAACLYPIGNSSVEGRILACGLPPALLVQYLPAIRGFSCPHCRGLSRSSGNDKLASCTPPKFKVAHYPVVVIEQFYGEPGSNVAMYCHVSLPETSPRGSLPYLRGHGSRKMRV